jgi:hypothetical protein
MFVKLTQVSNPSNPVWVNPAHVVTLRSDFRVRFDLPDIRVTYVMFANNASIDVSESPSAIMDMIRSSTK